MSQYCFSTFLSSAVRKWRTFSCRRSVSEKMSFSFFQEAYSSSGKIFTATVSNWSEVVCFSLALYTWAKRPFPTWDSNKSLVRIYVWMAQIKPQILLGLYTSRSSSIGSGSVLWFRLLACVELLSDLSSSIMMAQASLQSSPDFGLRFFILLSHSWLSMRCRCARYQ